MNIGERIKSLRKEKGMTAEQLGERLGKDRATIYRYESNDIKSMPLEILVPISEALDVSPVYIMGLTADRHFALSEKISLSEKESQIINMFREMNDEGQFKVCDYVKDLYEGGRYKKSYTGGMAANEA